MFYVYNDTFFSASTQVGIYGYAYGTEWNSINNFYPGRPLDNIGSKSMTVGVPMTHQNGYQFYFVLEHKYGRDNFVVVSLAPMVSTGNSNIIRKNNQ